jgi:hypothetical protein
MKQAITCPLNSMLAAIIRFIPHHSRGNKAPPDTAGLLGPALGPPTNAQSGGFGRRKRGPLQSVPDGLKQLRELLPVLQAMEV